MRHFILSEYFGVEDDGKFTFAGVFDQIHTAKYPTELGVGILTVVLNAMIGEEFEGEFVTIKLRAEGTEGSVAMVDAPIPATGGGVGPTGGRVDNGTPITLFVRISVKGLVIPEPGVYYFDADLKGETRQTVRLRAFTTPTDVES